jgi:hypothetical protein
MIWIAQQDIKLVEQLTVSSVEICTRIIGFERLLRRAKEIIVSDPCNLHVFLLN